MDLTGYTDDELDALRHEVNVELDSRLRLVQAKQNIAQLTHVILDAGGTVEEAQAAVVDGKADKEQADADKAAKEAEEAAAEEAANNPPVDPPVEPPVEPVVEDKPKAAKKTAKKK